MRPRFLFAPLLFIAATHAAPLAAQGPPILAILIDDSLSMGVADRYPDDKDVRKAVDQLARAADLKNPTRLQLASTLLTRKDPDWLDFLSRQRKMDLAIYHLTTEGRAVKLCEIPASAKADQLKEAREKIRTLTPKARASKLGTAVRGILADFRGPPLAGVLVLSDGVTTEGEDLAEVSRYAAGVKVPLFFVGIGDSQEKDLSLSNVDAPEMVHVDESIVFSMQLNASGFKDLTVPVELREKGQGKLLASQKVKVDPTGDSVRVLLRYQATEAGDKIFELRVPVQDGESKIENNVIECSVRVIKPKAIRVLYVEGEPRWEFRFVKSLLEQENKSFDLKVLLLSADPDWHLTEKTALSEFPQKKELDQFDVVILGDFDPQKLPKSDEKLRDLADFVTTRGRSLLMIAGERFAPHAFKDSPLADVLPIKIVKDRQPPEPKEGLTESYRPELTPKAWLHPMFDFSHDLQENEAIWKGLPELYWWSQGYEARTAARVLATRPRSLEPLIVQRFSGKGNCLFFGLNETWRWRRDEMRFEQFWTQTMRYLVPGPGRAELRLDRTTRYRENDPIRIQVRFSDSTPPPSDDEKVAVSVERNGELSSLELTKLKDREGLYEGILKKTPPGKYRFVLRSPRIESEPQPHAECVVLEPPGEMDRLRMNRTEMEKAAEASRGQFATLAGAEELLKKLPTRAK